MTGPPVITPLELSFALVFIAVAGACSFAYKLRLEKDLAIGTVRTFAQLLLMGLVLRYVFQIGTWWVSAILFGIGCFVAARTVASKAKGVPVRTFEPVFVSMLVGYGATVVFVVAAIVGAQPWYDPRFFVPLGGMVLGNSMNAMALALERLVSGLREGKDRVELLLSLGATPAEATAKPLADAMRAGMMPSINALMTVGLVSLPGMMTGQILAGQDPVQAVKYQIVVMVMLAGATAVGTLATTLWVRNRLLGPTGVPNL